MVDVQLELQKSDTQHEWQAGVERPMSFRLGGQLCKKDWRLHVPQT